MLLPTLWQNSYMTRKMAVTETENFSEENFEELEMKTKFVSVQYFKYRVTQIITKP